MNLEILLGIFGTVIASIVAITTIWQGVLTRRHNRLSVKPLLRFDRNIVLNEFARIELINNGVGPAIIDSILMKLDGIPFIDSNPLVKINDKDILEKFSSGFDISMINFRTIHEGESISSKESMSLIETNYKMDDRAMVGKHYQLFSRITITIRYHSIYNELYILDINK